MCLKEPYNTFKEAKKAASGLIGRLKTSFRVYQCNECDMFHVTSVAKNRQQKPTKIKYSKLKQMTVDWQKHKNEKPPKPIKPLPIKPQEIKTTYKPFQRFFDK